MEWVRLPGGKRALPMETTPCPDRLGLKASASLGTTALGPCPSGPLLRSACPEQA